MKSRDFITAGFCFLAPALNTALDISGYPIDSQQIDTTYIASNSTATSSTATNHSTQDTILGSEYEAPAQLQPGLSRMCQPWLCGKGNDAESQQGPYPATTLFVARGEYKTDEGRMVVGEVAFFASGTIVASYPA